AAAFSSPWSAYLEVRDDKCFAGNQYLRLAEVRLDPDDRESTDVSTALLNGRYEMHLCTLDSVRTQLESLLPKSESTSRSLPRIMDATSSSFFRVGLVDPIFDVDSISAMPFRRSTTVISDTSGVIQGGLNFVAR